MEEVYQMTYAQRIGTITIIGEMNNPDKFNLEEYIDIDNYFISNTPEEIKKYYEDKEAKNRKRNEDIEILKKEVLRVQKIRKDIR